jgi:hypothetical protein
MGRVYAAVIASLFCTLLCLDALQFLGLIRPLIR